MQTLQKRKEYFLPSGSFSRTYVGQDGIIRAVAYHTPTQSVAMLEGDSANVWQRIFDAKGKTEEALAYILDNGHFAGDPSVEAQAILDGFVASLCNANLLVDLSVDVGAQRQPNVSTSTIRNVANASENAETIIGQFMADNRIFYSLVLELTYRCNERCVHCYCPEHRQTAEMTASQIAALLDEFQSMGGMSLLITGGEVFARKDIKVILQDLERRNIVVNVISNLTMADEEDLELLANLNPRSIGCSIYSGTPTIHDKVTRLPGSWSRSVAAIRHLRDRSIPVIIKAPLMEINIHEWRAIEDLANELGCDVQFDVSITPKNDGKQSPIDLRVKDQAVLEDLFSSRFYRIYKNEEPMVIASEEQRDQALLCGAGSSGLAVGPDGTIRACIGLMNKIGHWPHESLLHVWDHSSFFTAWTNQRLMDIAKCSTCQYFSFCNRCPGSWQLETGSVTEPANYTCYLARIWSGCSMNSTQC
ncbi:MAG: radical SAM protein [Terracidiphilus sp.]|nr:radical SAM protein [Terracidiphilus sp.]